MTEVLGRLGNIELGLAGGNDDWQITKVNFPLDIVFSQSFTVVIHLPLKISLMSIVIVKTIAQVTVQFHGYVNEEYVFHNGYTLPPNINLTSFSKYYNLKASLLANEP